jgi:transposase
VRADAVKRNAELEEELRVLQTAFAAEKAALEKKLKASERHRDYLELKLAELRRMLFGRRSEKVEPMAPEGFVQAELFEEARAEIERERAEEEETVTYERKKRRGNRKPLPEDLHRERVEIDVPPEMRKCPDCKDDMCSIGEHVVEELEYIPAKLYVIEYALKKYACKKCQSGVVMEPVPPRPIKKGRPGPGLLAWVLVSKYQDHLPLHRLERIFERHGLGIHRSTLCDWVSASARLLGPIVEAMKRELLRSRVLQADETPVPLREPGLEKMTRRAYIWTYGLPRGEVVYDFTPGRSGEGPRKFLGEFEGYLQTDAYSGYNAVFESGRVIHLACWAHARRKFYDARVEEPGFADMVLAAIQKLYRLEREAKEKGVAGEALVDLRTREARPVLLGIRELLDLSRGMFLPRSGLGEAIDYTLGQWDALLRYVEIPEAEIDNNAAERSMRRVVLGRNNWLFVGHPEAGPRAAVILSLVETCRRLEVNPYEYLRSVLHEIVKDPSRAAALTPRAWRSAQLPSGPEKPGHSPAG